MHIDSYQFGEIVIDGTSYDSDCIILGGSVDSAWWRKQGHLLSPEDIETVLKAKPSVLVVGCGASGIMKIADQTREILEQHGIKLEAFDTTKAVRKFNELSQAGINVAAVMHLTC